MSGPVSGSRGGTPSTTTPIAGPWLSPQVVKRNSAPKQLPAIVSANRPHQLDELLLQLVEIHRLAQEGSSAQFVGAMPALVVAISGHHQDRKLRPQPPHF